MFRTTISIKGMHCRSCEMMIEDELLKIPGVKKAVVHHKKGIAEIYHKKDVIRETDIEKAIKNAGYQIGFDDEKPFFSKNIEDYKDLGIAFVFLITLYFVLRELGFFNIAFKSSGNYSSLLVVFLVGITAGFSTCMALVGGLVLGISSRFSEIHPHATTVQKFRPHLFFNLGRIISFFILGGIIGYAGSLFQLSSTFLGILTVLVGSIMFIIGLQLVEIFPRLSRLKLTLPKNISRILGIRDHQTAEYSHKNASVLGALTFFLPCGFTQAMQLYAISSGRFLTGALTMGIFAVGTTPGLLGIGGLTSTIRGILAKKFFKFAGLVVIVLAIFNMSNGYNLTGWNFTSFLNQNYNLSKTNDQNVTLENGIQIVRMTQTANGYEPNAFVIKKDVPVRWIIDSKDPYSCAASIASPRLGIRTNLQEGENVIEFTPKETGLIKFSCAMGMYTGIIEVVDKNN